MKERIAFLREAARRHKGLSLRWHEPAMSFLEGVLSRGGRRLADVLEKAFRKGAIFSSWVEGFRLDPWLDALAECGMTPEEWTGARDGESPLPWDHIQAGVDKNFLLKERERALRGLVTEDCRYAACRLCGACDTKAGPSLLRARDSDPEMKNRLNFPERDQTDAPPLPPKTTGKSAPPALDPALVRRAARFRLWHRKDGRAAWISQLELQSLLDRAMRRAGLPLAFSQGFHPLPLLSFGRALPVGAASLAEWCAITLRDPMRKEDVMERLEPCMLPGLECVSVDLLPLNGKIAPSAREIFRLECPPGEAGLFRRTWEAFAAAGRCDVENPGKEGENGRRDIRPFLLSLEFRQENAFLTLDWRAGYFSPLKFARAVMPWLDPVFLNLTKLAQIFD
jgi:radical SAM-linked protein